MLDLRQLQALQAIGAEGSVAKAARRLGVSQPSIDYHLKALETEVGSKLIERSNRGSTLTAAGALMAERGHEILALSNRAIADVRAFANLERLTINFASFPTAAARLLPQVTQRMREVGIELQVILEEIAPIVSRINSNAVDAALVYAARGKQLPFRSGVQTTHLLTDPLLLALPSKHPEATRPSFSVSQLRKFTDVDWVLGATPGDTIDEVISEVFGATSVNVRVRTDDYAVVMGLVASEMGFALVPQLAATNLAKGVALRPISDQRFAREILLATPNSAALATPAVGQLIEALRRAIDS